MVPSPIAHQDLMQDWHGTMPLEDTVALQDSEVPLPSDLITDPANYLGHNPLPAEPAGYIMGQNQVPVEIAGSTENAPSTDTQMPNLQVNFPWEDAASLLPGNAAPSPSDPVQGPGEFVDQIALPAQAAGYVNGQVPLTGEPAGYVLPQDQMPVEAGDQAPSPNTQFLNAIPAGVAGVSNPGPPPSPLPSPMDIGGLKKDLTAEAAQSTGDVPAESASRSIGFLTVPKKKVASVLGLSNDKPATTSGSSLPVNNSVPTMPVNNNNNNTIMSANNTDAIIPVTDGTSDPMDIEPAVPARSTMPSDPTDSTEPLDANGLNHEQRKYLRHTAAGFIVTNFALFVRSPYVPPPRRAFVRVPAMKYDDDFHEDQEIALAGFNKSRPYDRICPACFTWFRIGENVFNNPENFKEFFERQHRGPDSAIDTEIQRVGCCGPVCKKVIINCRRENKKRTLKRICREATLRRGSKWRRLNVWRKVPTPPPGVQVRPADDIDKSRGIMIIFVGTPQRQQTQETEETEG
ncbi:hypothetical protein VTL71DRAFT_3100 [Oculimacula yallundae]|uniref:Uncharacterized protein n=1 Tax=Oculimacula yallundae TaxID=86028 RepID=A0ABR4C654_9HELO